MLFVRKIMWGLLAAPGAAILVALAVANRHKVILKLDPMRPDNPEIAINLPLYAYIFTALIVGMLIGGGLTWLSQGRFRIQLRHRKREVHHWQTEADRLDREMKATRAPERGPSERGLPAPVGAGKA